MMGTSIVHIVAGGPEHLIPSNLFTQKNNIKWLGVDRGVYILLKNHIIPDLAVGDFDSVNSFEMDQINKQVSTISRYEPEKNETDMELAIRMALDKNPDTIKIFGATGGRMDHFLANAFLLLPYQQQFPEVKMEIIDIQNTISIHFPNEFAVTRNHLTYISFLPLSEVVQGLTLTGFKYPLYNKSIKFGTTLCISNELAQQTGNFSFEKGILMMIRSTDSYLA